MFNYVKKDKDGYDDINLPKVISHCLVLLIAIILFFGSFGKIEQYERGVKTRGGALVGIVQPGYYFKFPFIEAVNVMDLKTRAVIYEKENPLTAASKDLQDVSVTSVVNYHIDPTLVEPIYVQFKGVDEFEAQIVRPAVRDTVKASSAQFTAEELGRQRAAFSALVLKTLNEKLQGKGVVIEQSDITDLKFSDAYTKAIEDKVVATQNAETAKNNLEKVKFEQQAQIEVSKAQAEKTRLEAIALASAQGEKLIDKILAEAALAAANKWNGVLPTQMIPGGTLPFINVSSR
jgi:regulator of protease activity HflC (stomatin/prohibitin superfamily)